MIPTKPIHQWLCLEQMSTIIYSRKNLTLVEFFQRYWTRRRIDNMCIYASIDIIQIIQIIQVVYIYVRGIGIRIRIYYALSGDLDLIIRHNCGCIWICTEVV